MQASPSLRCLFHCLELVRSVGLIAAKRLCLLQLVIGGWVCAELSAASGAEFDLGQSHPAAVCACGDDCGQPCYGVDDDPGHPRKPHRTLPGDRDLGDCPPLRYQISDCRRAGYPYRIAPWAICARPNTHCGRYTAWFVGGGAVFADLPGLPINLLHRGRDRKANGCGQFGEGTWGLDYQWLGGYTKVWLKYTQHLPQGWEGRYETDGGPPLIEKFKSRVHELVHH